MVNFNFYLYDIKDQYGFERFGQWFFTDINKAMKYICTYACNDIEFNSYRHNSDSRKYYIITNVLKLNHSFFYEPPVIKAKPLKPTKRTRRWWKIR